MSLHGDGPGCGGPRSGFAHLRCLLAPAGLTLLAGLLVWSGCRVMPLEKMFPDFICYWAAARIVWSGASPYDTQLQAQEQQALGWNRGAEGFGIYDFLPYYYPPWFAFLCLPLLPLGYGAARLAWFFINVELTLTAGYLLAGAVPGLPRWLPMVLAPCFLFSLMAVLLGQTSPLVFFLVVLAWRLLQRRQDAWAGAALAWLTLKPQLTAVLLLALVLWLVRQRRWGVLASFAIVLTFLFLASWLVVPGWIGQLLRAPQETPSPTEHFPWIGNSWFLLLRAVGLEGWPLRLLYLAVALPVLLGPGRAIALPKSC